MRCAPARAADQREERREKADPAQPLHRAAAGATEAAVWRKPAPPRATSEAQQCAGARAGAPARARQRRRAAEHAVNLERRKQAPRAAAHHANRARPLRGQAATGRERRGERHERERRRPPPRAANRQLRCRRQSGHALNLSGLGREAALERGSRFHRPAPRSSPPAATGCRRLRDRARANR